jgi:hypothetical protein
MGKSIFYRFVQTSPLLPLTVTQPLSEGTHYPDLPNPRPVILRKRMSWDELLGYFRTWSSLHTYHERHPADRERSDGDIAVRFWNELKDGAAAKSNEEKVDVEWPVAMILVKKA